MLTDEGFWGGIIRVTTKFTSKMTNVTTCQFLITAKTNHCGPRFINHLSISQRRVAMIQVADTLYWVLFTQPDERCLDQS